MVPAKAVITKSALLQRINHKLAQDDKVLRVSRGHQLTSNLGRHFVVNLRTHAVEECQVDPVALARKIGVLSAWEAVQEEDC